MDPNAQSIYLCGITVIIKLFFVWYTYSELGEKITWFVLWLVGTWPTIDIYRFGNNHYLHNYALHNYEFVCVNLRAT